MPTSMKSSGVTSTCGRAASRTSRSSSPRSSRSIRSTFRHGCIRVRIRRCWRARWIDWRRMAPCRMSICVRCFAGRRAPRDEPLLFDGSHWNLAGGGVGYMAIMRAVQDAAAGRIPSIAPPVRPPYVPGRDVYWGDLAQMIGIPASSRNPTICLSPRARRDPAGVGLRARLISPDVDAFKIYALPDASLPRLLMNRDSMGHRPHADARGEFQPDHLRGDSLTWIGSGSTRRIPTS